MKKVFVSDKTTMILKSMENIDDNHILYDTYYEKEVDVNTHVHVRDNAKVYDNAKVFGNARVYGNAMVSGDAMVSGYGKRTS